MARRSSNRRVLGVCLGVSAGALLSCMVLVLVFLFTSCSTNKYVIASGLPTPDSGFQTGTVTGYNVWIWDCYQGKRIAVYNGTSELVSHPFQRDEAPCGQETAIEKQLKDEKKHPLDPKFFW